MATNYDDLAQFLAQGMRADAGGGPPRRNQVIVDALRRRLGLGPEAPNTITSQADTEEAGHMLDVIPKSPRERAQEELEAQPTRETIATGDALGAVNRFMDPRMAAQRAAQQKEQVGLEGQLATAKEAPVGAAQIALEHQKGVEARQTAAEEAKRTQELISGSSGGAGGGANVGAPGTWKPAINAQGRVSFTQNQMPALVQRSHQQLSEARDQVLGALEQVEKNFPGINDAAVEADQKPVGWLSGLLGSGPKYSSGKDAAMLQNEWLKYKTGRPTPYADFFQKASFGNISQMAGQLPGVRGLATVAPLFKEHQAKFGSLESPLSVAQRMRHMVSIMDETLSHMEGGSVEPGDIVFGEGKQ